MTTEPRSRLQFSLAALLVMVTIAALVVASITQLPDWIGAPVLAFVTIAAAAVVVTAAVQSKGYRRTFCIGAAFPLVMLLVQTSIVLVALVNGISDHDLPAMYARRFVQYGTPDYADQRECYRWAAACAMACAPLIGLLCVAFSWLGEPLAEEAVQRRGAWTPRRQRAFVLLTLLILLVTGFVGLLVVRYGIFVPDEWDRHDGNSVIANGSPATESTEFKPHDRILVEQGGTWWRGRVKQVNQDGTVSIHYVGWGPESDEVVFRSRLQVP